MNTNRRSSQRTARPRHGGKIDLAGLRQRFDAADENARKYVLYAFLTLVLLTGGASRHDVLSLIFLRPATFAFMAYALIVMKRDDMKRLPFPFWLLIALVALVALQLVPLPPSLWADMPHRAELARMAGDAGVADVWRPATLTPARTWNTLFSLSVPIAAFLLIAIQSKEARAQAPWLVILGAAVCVGFGMLQMLGGTDSIFYLYRITNAGEPVGVFANRNHEGLFLACAIVLSALVIHRIKPGDSRASLKIVSLVGFMLLLVPYVLIVGSRAGLGLSVLALAFAPWLIATSPWLDGQFRTWSRKGGAARFLRPRLIVSGVFGLLIAGLAGLAVLNSRSLALERFGDDIEGPLQRDIVFPYLIRMIGDFMPWGSGFGSFDAVFKQYEPVSALSHFYLNQAHDDWLQPLIEGGGPAAMLIALLVAWFVVSALRAFRSPDRLDALAPLVAVFMIGLASMVDYPLRVPICMVLLVLLITIAGVAGQRPTWRK